MSKFPRAGLLEEGIDGVCPQTKVPGSRLSTKIGKLLFRLKGVLNQINSAVIVKIDTGTFVE